MKRLAVVLAAILLLSGCASGRAQLQKKWTPEVRDAFVGIAKDSGCFDWKVVTADGRTMSCLYWYSYPTDKKGVYLTGCARLSKQEAPECYE